MKENAWESLVKVTGLLKETSGFCLSFLRTKNIKYKVPSTLGITLAFLWALRKEFITYRSYLGKCVNISDPEILMIEGCFVDA